MKNDGSVGGAICSGEQGSISADYPPCSSDVLALAKRIGEQQLAKAAAAPDELNVLINIHEHHDATTWRNRYQ